MRQRVDGWDADCCSFPYVTDGGQVRQAREEKHATLGARCYEISVHPSVGTNDVRPRVQELVVHANRVATGHCSVSINPFTPDGGT